MGGDDEAPKERPETTGGAASRPFGRGCALAVRRRRQAFARPLAGPPKTLPVLSAPGWILMSLLKLAQSSKLKHKKQWEDPARLDFGFSTGAARNTPFFMLLLS